MHKGQLRSQSPILSLDGGERVLRTWIQKSSHDIQIFKNGHEYLSELFESRSEFIKHGLRDSVKKKKLAVLMSTPTLWKTAYEKEIALEQLPLLSRKENHWVTYQQLNPGKNRVHVHTGGSRLQDYMNSLWIIINRS